MKDDKLFSYIVSLQLVEAENENSRSFLPAVYKMLVLAACVLYAASGS